VLEDSLCNSATTGAEGACTWIYSGASGSTGTCVPKSSQSYNCNNLVQEGQCTNGGNLNMLSGSCTWIYSSGGGSCRAINDSSASCEIITNTSQCILGGGITSLFGKCGLYNNVCKTLCSEVSESVCKNSRSGDCVWLEPNGTQVSGACVNSVCEMINIYLFIYL
jgi:hypothetical protein